MFWNEVNSGRNVEEHYENAAVKKGQRIKRQIGDELSRDFSCEPTSLRRARRR